MWWSKFPSLSSRSKPFALGLFHESFAHAALIRLSCLDAATHVYGLAVATAYALVDLHAMSQAVGQDGIHIREAQRVVRLDDRLGRSLVG